MTATANEPFNAREFTPRVERMEFMEGTQRAVWYGRFDVTTLKRYNASVMNEATKRATIYFDPAIHRALRLKAAELDRPISALVNEAVRAALAEDAEDLAAFPDRVREPNLSFEDVVKDLERRGKL